MTATIATANRVVQGHTYPGTPNLSYPVTASTHLYRNTLAFLATSSGQLVGVDNGYTAANYRFVGVNLMEVWNSASAAANQYGTKMPVSQSLSRPEPLVS
jgi:hypothetical protein